MRAIAVLCFAVVVWAGWLFSTGLDRSSWTLSAAAAALLLIAWGGFAASLWAVGGQVHKPGSGSPARLT